MSDNETPKRKYQRISAEHLAYAKRRFQEFASTTAVRAELKAMGGEYSHSQLHYYWHLANRGRTTTITGVTAATYDGDRTVTDCDVPFTYTGNKPGAA